MTITKLVSQEVIVIHKILSQVKIPIFQNSSKSLYQDTQ